MKSLFKSTLLFIILSQSLVSLAQNFQISSISNPIVNLQPCDSFISLSVAPLQADSLTTSDYSYTVVGTNYSPGPIQVDVVWGDGAITSHLGQMTTAGTEVTFTPELTHQYLDYNQHTMILNVSNPNNSSQAAYTTLVQVQNCTTYLYSFNSINCSGADPNLSNNVPYVFIDSQGNQYTEWMVNGAAISSQLVADNYIVTIAQWWLDIHGLIISSLNPQTIQVSPGGSYTFQTIFGCNLTTVNNCVAGTVYCDQNQNGIFDGGDLAIENAPITLTTGNQSYSTTSGNNGVYSFNYLNTNGGPSIISVDQNWLSQYGYSGGQPYTFFDQECSIGGQTIDIAIQCDSIGFTQECVVGWLFCDDNSNGVLDQNEAGFANAPVQIVGNNTTVTVYTNSNGNFYYSGNLLGAVAVVMIDQAWLAQNGYSANGNLVFTVQTDCNISQPVYFAIDCSAQPTPCADLWTIVSPWIGYYQNQVNYVKLKWGNNGPGAAQSYTLTLNYPAGVTPVTSSIQNSGYVISGNSISWTISSSSTYFNFSDVIYFNVPGGLSNGTAHNYYSTITANGNNQDCCLLNNQDTLTMILGNSYDPNDKTVNKSEIISPDVDDELTYHIRFQNTGTAPAQDIYIMDTLDANLDWTSIELLDASHYIQVIDLGNGIMKFNFPNIWLVDSTTSYEQSQGSLTYRIKENAGNSIGSTIENTAYIYFDWNPAIVTNTTFNINDVLSVDELNNVDLSIYPNPFTNELRFKSTENISEIHILDINGKIIQTKNGNSIDSISTGDLSPGVYLIEININNNWSTHRVIKN
ncbi:MAG: T9SS type A sorting domain-containing protein [Crocinitomicaceae bacterium]